jgi:urocanate hydratase
VILVCTAQTQVMYKPIRATRGNTRTAKGWIQEAAKRMLMNNLDPEVAEKPEELIVYGGRGKAARNWEAYHQIVQTLDRLENDQTLLVQSGKPVAVLETQPLAPRVLIANSNLVPNWATWDEFDRLDKAGLMMYGQMTAGSWIYIGTQGILQGTYETFAGAAHKHFGGTLAGTITVTAGLGGMGGAQPLAVKLAGGVAICIEIDPQRIQRRLETNYLDRVASNLEDAIRLAQAAKNEKRAVSIGLLGNACEVLPQMLELGFIPELVTDQTSSHDPMWGYLPSAKADEDIEMLRSSRPEEYLIRARAAMVRHVQAIIEGSRRNRFRLRQQPSCSGQTRWPRECLLVPRICARLHPRFFLRRAWPVSLGGLVWRPRGHRQDGRGPARTLPERLALTALVGIRLESDRLSRLARTHLLAWLPRT